ncbi:response regulator [Caulobacter sp. NIBR2454]|uniref:response regulator n=1 Tax=Caulobacter sp. NIBR2454 TaxID=3015996 RepID=UPI0022B6BD14|nr:response regulator [Caulobacter sp. NIBR2454]
MNTPTLLVDDPAVLIVEPHVSTARMLASLLNSLIKCNIHFAFDAEQARDLASKAKPDLLFVAHAPDVVDGLSFTRTLRQSDWGCRDAPVILTSAEPTAALIDGLKDAGVQEFLRRPYTMGGLSQRVGAATARVQKRATAVASRPLRTAEEEQVRVNRMLEAMKLMHQGLEQFEEHAPEAQRVLLAQAEMLRTFDIPGLPYAAGELKDYLTISGEALERRRLKTMINTIVTVISDGLRQAA